MADNELRTLLEALRRETNERTEALSAALRELTHDRGSQSDDDEHDPEGVSLSAEWSRLSGLLEGARDEQQQVDDALARMDAGTYGICANCGRPIPVARLRVRPLVTSRCVVEFLKTVRVSWFDYAAVSSGWATSSGTRSRSRMECSLK